MPPSFQFHKGTIKTEYGNAQPIAPIFQFHKGTIKTVLFLRNIETISHFNSIKVRLKHPHNKIVSSIPLFQFHKGTIKTEVAIHPNHLAS